jgi:hypothetical protein
MTVHFNTGASRVSCERSRFTVGVGVGEYCKMSIGLIEEAALQVVGGADGDMEPEMTLTD